MTREKNEGLSPISADPDVRIGSPVLTGGRGVWLAAAVLMGGLFVTATAVRHEESRKVEEEKLAFDVVCREVQVKIEERLADHEQILQSGAAFFMHNSVTRAEWHDFVEGQKINQRLPGILGIGFALAVPRAQLGQHTREVRSEGFPGYQVLPKGDREVYFPIIYLESFSGRNLRAFGYDMFSEPVRGATCGDGTGEGRRGCRPPGPGYSGAGDRSGCPGRHIDECARVSDGRTACHRDRAPRGSLTAIWFSRGGIRDMRQFFRRLKEERVDALDNGMVVNHHNLDEKV